MSNQLEVSVVLSGMSTCAQVAGRQNLASTDRLEVGTLKVEELATVDLVRGGYRALCCGLSIYSRSRKTCLARSGGRSPKYW